MMKIPCLLNILFSLILIFAAPFRTAAQEIAWSAVDELAQNYVKKRKNQGLVIGIIRDGARDIRGYGAQSREDDRPPHALTIFEIGGLTSVFTTSAAMLASYDYDFGMEDPIQPHIDVKSPVFQPQICMEIRLPNRERMISCAPDPSAETVCVSFCDLASHTAGMTCSCEEGYVWNPFAYVEYQEDEFYDISKKALYLSLTDYELESAPGEEFRYSNMGMALLGHIVSDIVDTSYQGLLDKYLTRPLNLPDTRLRLTDTQRLRLAPGHNEKGRAIAPWIFDGLAPAAGLRSTPTDLLAFLQANIDSGHSDLDAALEQVQQARVDVHFPGWQRSTQAGYGWIVSLLSDESNLPVCWINGGTGGYRAWMGFIKDTKTGLVILSNSAQPVDEMAWAILELLHP
jgi:D-alanyl-D-alanine-carboxypeptidase/D-alanyl-D-alanine-endopeptidase